MLRVIRQNLFVLVVALFTANIVYYVLLFRTLDVLFRLAHHGDAIPWFGRIVEFPWQLTTFAIFVLPLLLTLTATTLLKFRQAEASDWNHATALVSSVIIPYIALFSFVVFQVWMCVHSGQKGCFL